MKQDMSGAGKLRRWLFEGRLSQADLAARMGVTQTAISKWCSGIARPRWSQMPKLVEVTGGYVRPDDFMIAPSPPATLEPEREPAS